MSIDTLRESKRRGERDQGRERDSSDESKPVHEDTSASLDGFTEYAIDDNVQGAGKSMSKGLHGEPAEL